MATNQSFVDFTTPVPADWLNNVNNTVNYTASGGTVRTLNSKSADSISVKDFGAQGDGVTDDTAAIQAALTWIQGQNKSLALRIPAGVYKVTSQLTYTMPNSTTTLSIIGDGADVSYLRWTSGAGGLSLTLISDFNSYHVRDLSFVTDTTNLGTGLAITLTGSSLNPANTPISDISNVTFRGSNGYAAGEYWATCINVSGASLIDFTNVALVGNLTAAGLGIVIHGSATIIPVEFNLNGCSFYGLSQGFQYGNYVQGVTVNQCNFTNCTYGINIPASLTNLAQLTVTGSQFNCSANGIQILTNPGPGILILGNLFLVPDNAIAIAYSQAGLYSIIGNSFFPGTTSAILTTGIDIVSTSAVGVISGNTFYKMTSIAIALNTGTTSVNIQSNAYQLNGTNIVNNGSGNTLGGGSI